MFRLFAFHVLHYCTSLPSVFYKFTLPQPDFYCFLIAEPEYLTFDTISFYQISIYHGTNTQSNVLVPHFRFKPPFNLSSASECTWKASLCFLTVKCLQHWHFVPFFLVKSGSLLQLFAELSNYNIPHTENSTKSF